MNYTVQKILLSATLTVLLPLIGGSNIHLSAQEGGRLNEPINRGSDDYAPFVAFGEETDTLYFTTNREKIYDLGKARTQGFTKERRAEIWYSIREASARGELPINEGWGRPKYDLISANDPQFAGFTRGTFAKAGSRIVYAAERSLNTTKLDENSTSHLLDLWTTEDNFGTIRPIEEVNEADYWDSQPALSPDGNTLFFVSNRPVEIDGAADSSLNIFYSVREGARWSPPTLVPGINTIGNEASPHVGVDGYFYFSTTWRGSKNGDNYDIMRCPLDSRTGLPQRDKALPLEQSLSASFKRGLGEVRYNSPANEVFAFVAPDTSAIFFASDRESGEGGLDIYAYPMPQPLVQLQLVILRKELSPEGLIITPYSPVETQITLAFEGGTLPLTTGMVTDLSPRTAYSAPLPLPASSPCFSCVSTKNNDLFYRTGGRDSLILDTLYIDCTTRKDSVTFSDAGGTPYFVTGYWKPNTRANFEEFRRRRDNGDLSESNFIESEDYNYDEAVPKIEQYFEAEVFDKIEKVLATMSEQCFDDPVLKITVHGFTDACGLRPGRYAADSTFVIGDLVVEQGLSMQSSTLRSVAGAQVRLPDGGQAGNIILSKLRAHFTQETIINEMSSRSELFRRYFSRDTAESKVHFQAEGFGILEKNPCKSPLPINTLGLSGESLINRPCNSPQSRSFTIYYEILPRAYSSQYVLGPCGRESEEYRRWLRNKERQEQRASDSIHTLIVQQQAEEVRLSPDSVAAEEKKEEISAGPRYVVGLGTAANEEELKLALTLVKLLDFDNSAFDKVGDDIRIYLADSFDTPDMAEGSPLMRTMKQRAARLKKSLEGDVVQRYNLEKLISPKVFQR